MIKRLREFTHADAQAFCKMHFCDKLIEPCKNCPAYAEAQTRKKYCIFKAKSFVMDHMNMFLDDGSIPDEDLKYWQR